MVAAASHKGRISCLFSSIFLFFLLSLPCLGDTLDKIYRTNEFRIGYRDSSLPFSYVDRNEKIRGYSIDLCLAIAEKIKKELGLPKLKIVYTLINSQNRIVLLQSGTIDIDCGSTSNLASRHRQADFSDNTFLTHIRMLVRKGSSIQDFSTIGRRKVVVSAGTSSDTVLEKYAKEHNADVRIIYGKDHANSFLLLVTGRASAFVNDDVLLYGMKARLKNNAEKFVVLPAYLRVEPYGLMFRKKDPRFRKIVNETLEEFMHSGKILALYDHWFNHLILPENINLAMPLSEDNKNLFLHPNDRPAEG